MTSEVIILYDYRQYPLYIQVSLNISISSLTYTLLLIFMQRFVPKPCMLLEIGVFLLWVSVLVMLGYLNACMHGLRSCVLLIGMQTQTQQCIIQSAVYRLL